MAGVRKREKSCRERHKAEVEAAEGVIAESLEEITRQGIELAKGGKVDMIKYYTDRAMGKPLTPMEMEIAGMSNDEILEALQAAASGSAKARA